MTSHRPSRSALAALAEKYADLHRLRRARDAGAEPPAAQRLRDLSSRFPGSLRELDTLGAAEIARRARAAAAAAQGGPIEPWMSWIYAFHRLMAATLALKGQSASRAAAGRAQPRSTSVPEGDAETAIRAVLGAPLAAPFLAAIPKPPRGRLVPLVVSALASAFSVEPELFENTLFPRRRKRSHAD